MRVHAADSAFIRARRRDVHPLLRDPLGYGAWWPGVHTRQVGVAATVVLCGRRGRLERPTRILAQVIRDRPDLGVTLSYSGDLRGEAEWYYLDEPTGVIVTYLLRADVADRGWRRRLSSHRARVRAALVALGERFDRDRPAGAEPPPELRADQAAARSAYEAGIAAGRRRSGGAGAVG